jgi:hypothetical protein
MKFLYTFNLHHSIAYEYMLGNRNMMFETIQQKEILLKGENLWQSTYTYVQYAHLFVKWPLQLE